MDELVRGALVGIAVGGFVAAVVEANKVVVKTLLHFNFLAAEAAGCMIKGFYNDLEEKRQLRLKQNQQLLAEIEQRRQQGLRWQQFLAEDEPEDTDDENEEEN